MSDVPVTTSGYLWWVVTAAVGALGYVISRLIDKGIIGRLDDLTSKLENFVNECHKCQMEARKEFTTKVEFNQLLGVRQEAHNIINGRLHTLENTQSRIENKLDTFHDDMKNKMNRLSKTFVFRDAVISMRLDNLSDKVGVDKWTKEQEEELALNLKTKLDEVEQ